MLRRRSVCDSEVAERLLCTTGSVLSSPRSVVPSRLGLLGGICGCLFAKASSEGRVWCTLGGLECCFFSWRFKLAAVSPVARLLLLLLAVVVVVVLLNFSELFLGGGIGAAATALVRF